MNMVYVQRGYDILTQMPRHVSLQIIEEEEPSGQDQNKSESDSSLLVLSLCGVLFATALLVAGSLYLQQILQRRFLRRCMQPEMGFQVSKH